MYDNYGNRETVRTNDVVPGAPASQETFVPEEPPKDKNYAVRDFVTGDYYSGRVDPDLVASLHDDDEADYVLATSRTIVIDNYGRTENVWLAAPVPDLPGPVPGEYRKVYFVEIDD